MKKLVIIGASALGRETVDYAQACGMAVRGFLDSRRDILDGFAGYPPVLGAVEGFRPEPDDVFVCALGEPEQKRKYVALLADADWANVVHPTAIIGRNVRMGRGCIIRPFAVVGNDTVLGDHVTIGTQSLVAHDCMIGDFSVVSPGAHIAGWCRIAAGSFLGIHSAVVPHVELGSDHGVLVAAGAVVTKSTIAKRVMGIPAKER